MDHQELGRFVAHYTPAEWAVWMTGACAMTQSSNVLSPDHLCHDDRVSGYTLCEYHLDDMRDNYRRTDAALRIPAAVVEWLSY